MKIHCPRCRKRNRDRANVIAVWMGDTITAYPGGGNGVQVQGVDRATFYCGQCQKDWVVIKQPDGTFRTVLEDETAKEVSLT